MKRSDSNLAEGIQELAHAPVGERTQPRMRGILLPLAIAAYAVICWYRQKAEWFGGLDDNESIPLIGEEACAVAGCYFSLALFLHFKWYWGLASYQIFQAGMTVSIFLGVSGGGAALYYHLK